MAENHLWFLEPDRPMNEGSSAPSWKMSTIASPPRTSIPSPRHRRQRHLLYKMTGASNGQPNTSGAAFQLEVPFLSPSSATTATSPPCFLDGHRQHFYFLPLGRLYEASVRKPNPHEFKAKGNLLGYRVRRSNPDGERGCHQTRLLFSSQLATGGLPGHHTAPSDVTAPASQPPRFNSSRKSKLPSHCCPNLPPKSALILIGPA